MNPLPGFPLSDPHQVALLLQHLIGQADGDQRDQVLSLVSDATLEQLKRTPASELVRLARQRPAFISVIVDEPGLNLARHRLRHMEQRRADVEWFIRHGAPAAAMLELFGMVDGELRRLRRKFACAPRRGRARKLDTDTARQVVRCWSQSRDRADDLTARFRLLAEQFPELPLPSLWSAFKEMTG